MTRSLLAYTLAALVAIATPAAAQTTSTLEWDQAEATLAAAQANSYTVTVNGVKQSGAATCTGTASPFVCRQVIPALKPGTNTIVVTAASGGFQASSAPLTGRQPGTPGALRVVITITVETP
jgi:hypothetical protein